MKKRLFALLLALGMLTTMLSGCGNQTTSAPSSEKAAPASVPEAEAPSEAPASAKEAPSTAEESVLEDTHEFAEGAGVFPIADGDETITIFDGWFPFFAAILAWRSYADTLFFQEMENAPVSRQNSSWRTPKPQGKVQSDDCRRRLLRSHARR